MELHIDSGHQMLNEAEQAVLEATRLLEQQAAIDLARGTDPASLMRALNMLPMSDRSVIEQLGRELAQGDYSPSAVPQTSLVPPRRHSMI